MTSLLRIQKLGLILGGLLPMNLKSYLPDSLKFLAPVLDNFFVAFGIVNMVHLMAMCTISMIIAKESSFEMTIIKIQDITTCFTAAVYVIRFVFFRKHITEVTALVEKELPSRSAPGIVYIEMEPTVKRARTFSIAWIACCVLGTAQHGLSPLLDRSGQLPFQIIYPFDHYKSPVYEIVYAIQFLGAVQFGFIYSAFTTYFVSICRLMTVQYEMLLCSLTNMVNSACIRRGDTKSRELLKNSLWKWKNCNETELEYFEALELEDDHGITADGIAIRGSIKRLGFNTPDAFEYGEYDKELCEEVIQCIRRHCLILRIAKSTEDMLSFNMLNTMVNLVFILCLIIFALAEMQEFNNNSVHFLNYLMLGYVAMILQCYYPHIMSMQSNKIIDAIQKTPWHLFGPSVRKYLRFMMMNSQTPFYFTGGKLFNLDLALFVVVRKELLIFWLICK